MKGLTLEGNQIIAKSLNKFQFSDRFPDGVLCPDCKGKMFLVQPSTRCIHFRHNQGYFDCPGKKYDSHPETTEHLLAKYEVYIRSLKQIQEGGGTNLSVEMEYSLPKCGRNGRRADVALLYKGRVFSVIECQLSQISLPDLKQRILDYAELSIESAWMLGKDANTEENRKGLLKYTDKIGFLSFDSSEYVSIEQMLGDWIRGDSQEA